MILIDDPCKTFFLYRVQFSKIDEFQCRPQRQLCALKGGLFIFIPFSKIGHVFNTGRGASCAALRATVLSSCINFCKFSFFTFSLFSIFTFCRLWKLYFIQICVRLLIVRSIEVRSVPNLS